MTAPMPPRGSTILVFGHHDLDGIVSAAIAGSYLRHLGLQPVYATVDFGMKQAWARFWHDLARGRSPWDRLNGQPMPAGLAIVDFQPTWLPDDCFLFFADHHKNSLDEVDPPVAGAIQQRRRRGEPICHDPECGSCAELLLRELVGRDGWQPPETLVEAARLAHASDVAAFPSPSAAVDFERSDLARADLFALSLAEPEAARSIAALEAGALIREALVDLHADRARDILQQANEARAAYERSRQMLMPNVAVFDFTTGPIPQRIKLAEFSDPRVHYAIQLRPGRITDTQALVQGLIGRSPWAPPLPPNLRHPDLEIIARELAGGGGHPYAAGFQVVGRTLAQARAYAKSLATLIAAELHPVPPHHPYADLRSERRPAAPQIRLPAAVSR